MTGHIAALYRHPVKGFTPEGLHQAQLTTGEAFPCDRLYAVENGHSGFDPRAPAYLPKQKFTVLMSIPRVAKARTRYDEATETLQATAEGLPPFEGRLGDEFGRGAFAAWLETLLGDERRGPLKVLSAQGHRFMDSRSGDISIVNLASVRDLEQKLGRPLDPLRFRANLYVEGWPAWAENDWTGKTLMAGFARVEVVKPIVRCAATHVDPTTAERDIEVVRALFDNYGHTLCGIYVRVTDGGLVSVGDACTAPLTEAPSP